jgi:hypothetical protein
VPNPFFRPGSHHLIYDGDLNPEGLALRYTLGDWFVNYAGLMVEEREAADDSVLLGGQIGIRRALANAVQLTAGAGYYGYRDTQGRTPFWDGAANGNRVDSSGNYLSVGELGFVVGERPLTLFADYVRNTGLTAWIAVSRSARATEKSRRTAHGRSVGPTKS